MNAVADGKIAARSGASQSGFWWVAAAIAIIVLGANTPLPILTIYQATWHFTTATLSVIYGVYTAGVIAAVFLLGPASDRIGRKRVLIPALITMMAGLLLGMLASGPATLIVSRILEGLAVGAGTTTAVAALGELNSDTDNHGRVALTATVATVLGLAGGPLLAGSLAQFAPAPTITPYILALLLCGAVTVAVLATPETVVNRSAFKFQPVTLAVPAESASAFYLATFVEMTAYAVAGTFAGLGGSFARDLLHITNHFAAGLAVALLFCASAAAQLLVRSWPIRRAIGTGLPIIVVGLLAFAGAVMERSGFLFFVCAAILGAGHGLAYLGAQELTDRIAPPERRAQVLSAFQLGLYVGATVPAVVVGFVAGRAGLQASTLGFVAVVITLALVGLVWLRASQSNALNP